MTAQQNALLARSKELSVSTVAEATSTTGLPTSDFYVRIAERGNSLWETGAKGAFGAPDGYSILDGDGVDLRLVVDGLDGISIRALGGVSDINVTDNSGAIQAAYDLAASSEIDVVLWDGAYGYSSTINIPANVVTKGFGTPQAGSDLPLTTMYWTGGASPMMQTTNTRLKFIGLGVQNLGSATDWLEMNSGSQRITLEDFYCSTSASHVAFTRSVIRSNGNRLGYSYFKDCYITTPAPKFIDIDGQGTGNGITTIRFEGGIYDANGDMTVVNIKDEGVELLSIKGGTYIGRNGSELIMVDTSDTPIDPTIRCLTVNDNEIEPFPSTGHRVFKLHNVNSFILDENQVTYSSGSAAASLCDLVNSTVSECTGNDFLRITDHVFNPDANSRIIGGKNSYNDTNTFGLHNVRSAGIVEFTYASVMVVDLEEADGRQNAIFLAEITDTASYQFRITDNNIYQAPPGQVFTIIVSNQSGGAIAQSSFTIGFITPSSPYPPPAAGNEIAYTFYWDGTNAKLLYVGDEVASS